MVMSQHKEKLPYFSFKGYLAVRKTVVIKKE